MTDTGAIKTLFPRAMPGRRRKKTCEENLQLLRQAAELASEALLRMLEDEKQFQRHVYTEKADGSLTETVLDIRNIRQLRETIAAIRDLTDAVRGLSGELAPEQRTAMEVQMRKLQLEEKKLEGDADRGETGVVLLPDAETDDA